MPLFTVACWMPGAESPLSDICWGLPWDMWIRELHSGDGEHKDAGLNILRCSDPLWPATLPSPAMSTRLMGPAAKLCPYLES